VSGGRRGLRRALALCLAAAGAACEPAARPLRDAPSGSAGATALLDSIAARFGASEREPAFDALRPKLERAAFVPSRVFDDRAAWPAAQTGDFRAVEFTGFTAGAAYRFGIRPEAPEAVTPGQYRGRLRLDRLDSGRFEWTLREELATGPLRPADLSAALDGLFRGLEQADEAAARAEARAAFPRAGDALSQLLALDQLAPTRDAQGATRVTVRLRLAPAGLRASAPRYASFVERYLVPIRSRLVVADKAGATWWTLEGDGGVWTLRLRVRGGSLVPLEGDAERRLPGELHATLDYATRMGRYSLAARGLEADVALTRTPVEKSFVARFHKEPDWDLPFLVETFLGGPLRFPFEGPGSEAGWGAREMPGGTQFFRHFRFRVRETFVLRWLGGMTSRAMSEFRAGAELEAERYYGACLVAARDDLADLLRKPRAAAR
jgi:hypothetical protein